jgi:hypothetical protein
MSPCTPSKTINKKKNMLDVRHLWIITVILATQEAEIRRIGVQGQSWTNSSPDLISKIPITKQDWQSGSKW